MDNSTASAVVESLTSKNFKQKFSYENFCVKFVEVKDSTTAGAAELSIH